MMCPAPAAFTRRSVIQLRNSRSTRNFKSCLGWEKSSSVRLGRVQAYGVLDPNQATAVTQQLVAFATLIGLEGGWAYYRMPEDNPGRPTIVSTLAAASVMLLAVGFLQFPTTQKVAEIGGLLASPVVLFYFVRRSMTTVSDSYEWPGAKAPPAGMALVAFFAWNIFLQAFRA